MGLLEPYRVVVGVVRPTGNGQFPGAQRLHEEQHHPNAAVSPFVRRNATSAADFNAISDGITALEPALMLPVAGVRGGEEVTTANTSTAWTQIRRINVQHRVNGVRVSLAITGADQAGHHIGAGGLRRDSR